MLPHLFEETKEKFIVQKKSLRSFRLLPIDANLAILSGENGRLYTMQIKSEKLESLSEALTIKQFSDTDAHTLPIL
jgi:hypothetical protein